MQSDQSNSDLTTVDRAILLALSYGGATGRELAQTFNLPGRSIGSRMNALRKRGLVTGTKDAGMTTWELAR